MKIPRVKIYMKFKYLLKSFFKNYHNSKLNIENVIKSNLNHNFIIFTGMCRTGFLVILEYLKDKYPEKKEILICSYNLKEMVDIARLKDFKIKLIDIHHKSGVMNLDVIKDNITNNTSAILFTNMFNDKNILFDLKDLCKNKNILLIEDNAIYYGNYFLDGNKKIYSGSIGDVALLSFGIMKNVSALFGGAIVTSNPEIFKYTEKKIESYSEFPKFIYIKQIILFIMLKFFLSKYIYNLFFFYVIKFATLNNISILLKAIYPSLKFERKSKIPKFYHSKISKTSVKIIDQIFNDKNNFEVDELRKKNNGIYSDLLAKNKNIQLINITDTNFQNFLDFPILVKNKVDLVNYLLKMGLETRVYFYPNCEDIIDHNNNKNSNYFEENLICLPSHSEINENKIKDYCKEINNFYQKKS